MIRHLMMILLFLISFEAFANQKATIQIKERPPFVMGDIYQAEIIFFPKGMIKVADIKSLEGTTLPGGKWYVGKVSRARESENNEEALVADLVMVPLNTKENNLGGVIKFNESYYGLTITSGVVEEVKPVSEKFVALDQNIHLPKAIAWLKIGLALLTLSIVLLMSYRWWSKRRRPNGSGLVTTIDWKEKIAQAKTRTQMEELFASRDKWAGSVIPKDKEVIDFFELMYRHQYKKEWPPETKDLLAQSLSKVKERASDKLS